MEFENLSGYLGCCDDTVVEGGYVFGYDTNARGDVRTKGFMQKAYDMGKVICDTGRMG